MGKKYNWENSEIIKINKENGHVIAMPFDSLNDAMSLKESKYKMSLNGKWKFHWGRGLQNLLPESEAVDFDDSDWNDINVPSVWQTQGYSVPYYYASTFPKAIGRNKISIPKIRHNMQEIGIYRRTFNIKKSWNDREIFIHFGAAKAALELFVNGEFVGYSQGSMTPHEFNVTKFLTDGENQLTVRVYRYSDGTYLEDQDMWWLCGIYRDVFLYAEPKICTRDFFFRTELDANYRNAEAFLDVYIENYSRDNGDLSVSAIVFDDKREIDLGTKTISTKSRNSVVSFSQKVINPKKWSAETPNLYTLAITVKLGRKTISVKTYKVGFKKVEIVGEKILINGQPLMVRGVNRHDFDADNGWNVPKERTDEDLCIMKRNNINAVRTSHYPNNLYFYEKCNELGLYVMDECEVESHGVRRKGVPGSNKKWTNAVVDRMERMVLRDRNNPCIFMWSLGNEAGDGSNFSAMKEAALKLDSTRQFHYEGDFDLTKSDVISRMYPVKSVMDKLGNKEEIKISLYDKVANQLAADSKPIKPEMYEGKPVLLCEYAHSMENSLGNFQEYMDDFEKYDNMCGGFIWDFVDQTIHKIDDDGKDMWLYGSDFSKLEPKVKPIDPINTTAIGGSNTYFCANGIIAADRTEHPSIFEVKKVYQEVKVEPLDIEKGKFVVKNKMLFSNVSNYNCKWVVEAEGEPVESGTIEKLSVAPLDTEKIEIPYNFKKLPNKECVLTISFLTKKKTPWCSSGYEQCFDQFILKEMPQPKEVKASGELDCIEFKKEITVSGHGFEIIFNDGVITSYKLGDEEILLSPMKPNYFRALTDNDIDMLNFTPPLIRFHPFYKWQRATNHIKTIKTNIEKTKDFVKINIAFSIKGLSNAVATYKVYPDGKVYVYHSAIPKNNMIRFGYELAVSKDFDIVSWYGRGPQETYCDRKTGAKIAKHNMTVSELEHRYMRPQENGNRVDVRNVEFKNDKGTSIKFTSYYNNPINFSAHHYTTLGLEKATHVHNIPYEDITTINIDHMMCGVGGDMPGCATLRDPYIMHSGVKQSFSFTMEIKK